MRPAQARNPGFRPCQIEQKVLSLRSLREGTIQTRPQALAVRMAADAAHEAVYAALYTGSCAASGASCAAKAASCIE